MREVLLIGCRSSQQQQNYSYKESYFRVSGGIQISIVASQVDYHRMYKSGNKTVKIIALNLMEIKTGSYCSCAEEIANGIQ